jgi:hypothetical protein
VLDRFAVVLEQSLFKRTPASGCRVDFSLAMPGGKCCDECLDRPYELIDRPGRGSTGGSGSFQEDTAMRLGLSRTMVASSFALAILIISVACLRAQDEKPQPDAIPSALAKGLMGTWVLAGTPEKEVEPPAKGGRLKFITAKHWTVTESDEAGKVLFHHGGTCTFEGDEYTETVKYANENTAELIGQSFKFKVKLEGEKYTQTGIGNPYTEVWRRAK